MKHGFPFSVTMTDHLANLVHTISRGQSSSVLFTALLSPQPDCLRKLLIQIHFFGFAVLRP